MLKFLRRSSSSTAVTDTSGKSFAGALDEFNQKLNSHENFSLARYGDGEMVVINGEAIDLSGKHNGEHKYVPGDPVNERQRELLRRALTYKDSSYFIGIACPCCVGEEKFLRLKQQSLQAEEQLTWANIFVNSNYSRFKTETVEALSKRNTILVSHESADLSGLPFSIEQHFRVGANAWQMDYTRALSEMAAYIESGQIRDHVFLFCAGVLSNILVYELHRQYPVNTYVDIGSVFDVELGLGKTRKYLKKGKTLRKTCVWM